MVQGSKNKYLRGRGGEGSYRLGGSQSLRNGIIDLQGISGVIYANRRMSGKEDKGRHLSGISVTYHRMNSSQQPFKMAISWEPVRNLIPTHSVGTAATTFLPSGPASFVCIPPGATIWLFSFSYPDEAKVVQGRRYFPYHGDINSPEQTADVWKGYFLSKSQIKNILLGQR